MLGKGDNRAIREVNRSIILDLVRRGGQISRTELAKRSRLTKPTVSAIVEDLIDGGVVREIGFGSSGSGGGRPARLLEFNEAAAASFFRATCPPTSARILRSIRSSGAGNNERAMTPLAASLSTSRITRR